MFKYVNELTIKPVYECTFRILSRSSNLTSIKVKETKWNENGRVNLV